MIWMNRRNNLNSLQAQMMGVRHTSWQKHVENILFLAARERRCIPYAELARQAQIPAPHTIHKLTEYLETLIMQDAEAERPLRASVAISKARQGLPADGFFMCCAELGLMPPDMDRQQFHQHCLNALFEANSLS